MADTPQKPGDKAGKVPPRPASQRPAVPRRPAAKQPARGAVKAGGRPTRASARQVVQRRRQRNIRMVWGAVGLVVVVIAVFVTVKLTEGTSHPKAKGPANTGAYALPVGVASAVEDVPASTLVSAALTSIKDKSTAASPPQLLPAGTAALTVGGKPEILYIGAEYCPYCAGERWAMVMALSKFGTFSDLKGTSSSDSDIDSSTPTFSFYGSTYKSPYLKFATVELETNTSKALQNPTTQQADLLTKWDQPPYVQSSSYDDSIPFIYLGGRYLQIGIQYTTAGVLSGWQITKAASYLTAGNNATSRDAEAAAGFLVGDICALTHGQPASVCSKVPKELLGIATTAVSGKGGSSATTTTTKPGVTTTTEPSVTTTTAKVSG
jgi:hypothetical protein